jgi:hypothetical protein
MRSCVPEKTFAASLFRCPVPRSRLRKDLCSIVRLAWTPRVACAFCAPPIGRSENLVLQSSCKEVASVTSFYHQHRAMLGMDVNPASPLDLEMILSGISHGHIVAFPDAADMHVFRTTVAFSQHFVA